MQLTRRADEYTITAAGYVVRGRVGAQTTVELTDAAGRRWSQLSLLASLDRIDGPDESFDPGALTVTELRDAAEHVVDLELATASTRWAAKSVRLRCFDDRLELTARVAGAGTLADVHLFGGHGFLTAGACGMFSSSIAAASVFDPTPTEPVQVVRPASAAVTLGIVGDASAGRLHSVFSPPPLCVVFGREPADHPTQVPGGDWLSIGVVAAVADLGFTELRYVPADGGFRVELDYDAQTTVGGAFTTPAVVLRPVTDPWAALARYRDDLAAVGAAPAPPPARPQWWSEPIFCGWGAQCAAATAAVAPPDLARQDRYDGWLARLDEHGVVPGTVVIDDRWQVAYGTAEPNVARWPDLRAWIAERHAMGQRVLLWWKAWDPEGLAAEECVLGPDGTPVSVDPGSPAYRSHLAGIVSHLIGPDGVNADGFKIDFTQRAPTGRAVTRPGATPGAPWGIAALHVLLQTIYRAAKAAKPDALVVTHTPHPGFADVTDMLRLNDILERDPSGAVVAAADQLAFRHRVVSQVLPDHLVDTDQWPILDRAAWRDYVSAQAGLGVPALYYAERIDGSGESLTTEDYALVAETWRRYRARSSASGRPIGG